MSLSLRATQWLLDWAYALRWQLSVAGDSVPPRYRSGDGVGILLIPGVFETWAFLRPVAERLRRGGHPVYAVPGFGHNAESISEMARRATAYLAANDLHDIVIVAHSKGGLIGKMLMTEDATADRILGMVAVNTPFGGSRLAALARSRALREFLPDEPLLRMLDDRRQANARILSVFSLVDPIIPDGSRLEGARNIGLPFVGHFRLLADSRVLTLVELFVARIEDDRRLR